MPEEQEKPKEEKNKEAEPGRRKFLTYAMVIAVAAVFFAAGLMSSGSITGFSVAMGPQAAAEKAVGFINENMLEAGMSASLVNVTEANGIYVMNIEISSEQGGAVYTAHLTKDGALLFTYPPVDLNQEIEDLQQPQETSVPKSDRPVVDVFIMSYCPYGLQMLKALLPAWELLDDKADINLRFVYYAMHGETEIDENTRMYCIQKEQRDSLHSYLGCFAETGDAESCLAQAGIDTEALDSCIAAADTEFSITANLEDQSSWLSGNYPLYYVDKELNEMYGVGGSPSTVINGQSASVSRSPEAVKQAICDAFNTPPEECSQTLSTDQAAPGIGGGTGSGSSGSCG